MANNVGRQLLIGLDAMEWNLVERWAAEGKLPTFQRLLKEGLHGKLKTTSAQLPDTVWASICTGANPGKFEKYFYAQYDPGSGNLETVPDDAIHGVPFWKYLSESGKRVSIVDVPKFSLSQGVNVLHLTNWGAHATKTARASSPESLLGDIDRLFGRHPVGDCDAVDEKPGALRDLRQRILAGVRSHGELFRWLMEKEQWDIFFAGFSAPHCIGHHFWHYMDPGHPRHNPLDPHKLNDTIEVIYRALDDEIAEMLALAGNNIQCLIMAGHGMGPLYHASWNLNEILDLLGYGQASKRNLTAQKSRQARANPWRLLKMVLPGKVQYAIKEALPKRLQDELIFRWYAGDRNWAGRRAFAIPNNDSVGAIRINVVGRDRYGVVQPGEEYERVCHEIADALYEIIDPESGRNVVKYVTFTHQEFQGPYLHRLPDLTVLWDQSFHWDSVQSARLGTLRLRRQDARSGSHTPHGFLLMHGLRVPAGRAVYGCSIYDIAPTVLQLAGVPIPSHMDGNPLDL
ncbi:MAG TPA: alkaline phosphatase family protein, partial [Nitrospira sp.]|nr:alkaline phosphatase family protein [Nitrospira sp.]